MRIALAQIDSVVGDVEGNAARIIDATRRAAVEGAELVVTPELSLLGYPPRDLLQVAGVVERCEAWIDRLARELVGGAGADRLRGVTVLVGHPRRESGGCRPLRNSVSVLRDGSIVGQYDKRLLPSYDVFDEDRHFEPGRAPLIVRVGTGGVTGGVRVGILLCEDLWSAGDVRVERRYPCDPVMETVGRGVDLLAVLSASPFVLGKRALHLDRLRDVASASRVPVVSVNVVGANDDLIFDGASCVMAPDGSVTAALPNFIEAVEVVEVGRSPIRESTRTEIRANVRNAVPPERHSTPDVAGAGSNEHEEAAELFDALITGIRGYFRKCRGRRAVLGLSGGIDSAVTAALATAALGADNVIGLLMPSRHSSAGSVTDALELAQRLRLGRIQTIPIEAAHAALGGMVGGALRGLDGDAASGGGGGGLVDENLQSRIRGVTVMAIANALDGMALATGNKSEFAVGYTTLYGDMIGALAPIGDLVKRRVCALARWMNEHAEPCGFAEPPIPLASIEKAPSAELRPDQTDQDTLPPYPILDALVEALVDEERTIDDAARRADCDLDLARRVALMIDRSEFKRRQAPIVLKVTPRAFGPGRRMPVASVGAGL